MTHTSGIKEYFDDDFCKIANQMGDAMTQDTILEMIKGFGDLEFEPDTNFSYCNSAYVMLGSIIEQVSKKTFAEFLKENIFDPLGMNNTVVGVSPNQKVANLTPGYMLTENGQFERTPLIWQLLAGLMAISYLQLKIFLYGIMPYIQRNL